MTTREYKTYRATAEGYDGDKLRLPGEKFTTNIPKGSWMVELDESGNPIEEAAPAEEPVKPTGEPGPLDGSIAELTTYLEGVTDVLTIDALIEAETKGNSRKGALEALNTRKAALQPA